MAMCLLCTGVALAEPRNCPYSLWNTSIIYRNLSYRQREMFDTVYDAVREQKTSVGISNLTRDEAWFVMNTLFNECAELCSISEWRLWGNEINGVWTPNEVRIQYKHTKAEQDRFINEAASLSRRFSGIPDIYVYLCQQLVYGDANAHPEHMYAYDSLKGGVAVCNGYAQSLSMLCHFAGYECSYITGYGNGGRHAWNIVRFGSDYTLVDCTWDDGGSEPSYRWFALSDSEMNRSHTPDEQYVILPACVNLQGSTRLSKWRTAAFDCNDLSFTLKYGDSGAAVRKINKRLIELGYLRGSASDRFDHNTKNAVAAFQKKNGIHGESASFGVCTQLTQAALFGEAARRSNENSVSPASAIYSAPFGVYVGSNYGVKRSGNGGTLTFHVKNNNATQPITAMCVRYWADDASGRLTYRAREQLLLSLDLRPGEMREITVKLAEDSGFRSAYTFKWNITEVAYANGEVFINENLSGADAYYIRTYNETVR